jgi:hypothetical protein
MYIIIDIRVRVQICSYQIVDIARQTPTMHQSIHRISDDITLSFQKLVLPLSNIYPPLPHFFGRLNKWASVLSTHSSKLHLSSSSNSNHAYLSVSASQKLSISSAWSDELTNTSATAAWPYSVRVAERIEETIFQPDVRQYGSPVMRCI